MKFKFKKMFPEALPPKRGNPYAAGIDLFLPPKQKSGGKWTDDSIYRLAPHETRKIDTGIAFEFPKGVFGLIRPRGSALMRGLVINGTIDTDYRGSVVLIITNTKNSYVEIEVGKSYAQMIPMLQDPGIGDPIEETGELSFTERGDGKLGSTGNS